MFRTLRRRFIFSHLVPLLIIVPLIGIALIYLLEAQVVLPSLSNELAGQAGLVIEMARDQPGVWSDTSQAQAFVARVSPRLTARLMLLDNDGRLLASSDANDADRLGLPLDHPGLEQALSGQPFSQQARSQGLRAEVADVLTPAPGVNQQVAGVVRLSYPLTSVYERFRLLRYLIAGVLVVGLILGAITGTALALDLGRPIQDTQRAAEQLAFGQLPAPLSEQGPEEIRSLAGSFNVLAARLHTLEESRRQLLANLVHELGRPLGALLAAVQALEGGADQEAGLRQELHAGMEAQIRRLQRLLDDLAQLHDRVLGSLQLDRQLLALAEWLPATLSPWREAAIQKGLDWRSSIPTNLPAISADPDRLAQAVGNLVSNAIKYTLPQGSVMVSAGSQAGEIWLRVSDTGPGIAAEEQARIFAPFYRGPSSGRFPQGMGLGLSIARDLVAAHGGRLTVESAPGAGSHFTIWLPVQKPPNHSEFR
jgi:two-component system, OmpR family, sensor histidine kinase BaeS